MMMPRSPTPIWLFTLALLVGYPLIMERYLTALAIDGTFSPRGDTIIIPIVGSAMLAIAVSPIVLSIVWFCTKRYAADTSMTVWRGDRFARSLITTLLAGFGISASLIMAMDTLLSVRVWEGTLLVVYYLAWSFWFAAMRAAYINEQSHDEFHFG